MQGGKQMSLLTLTLAVTLAAYTQVESEPVATPTAEAVTPVEGTPAAYLPPPDEREPVEREEKSYQAYRQELKKWFVQEATAEEPAERMEAIIGLCALYHELRTDPRYPLSDALQEYKIKIWSRLSKVKRELEYDLRDPSEDAAASEPNAEASDTELLTSTFNDSAAEARGGGARRGDFGDDLVELIEKTIAPTKWDVNGGPFTIVYYAPLHALVVRASSEVHGRVGGLLGGLRQAGN
jgi:hypothetical protein